MHEAEDHDQNAFITLTYDDEHQPADQSLNKRDFQLFMKRLRKHFPQTIRFYHCGEYGPQTGRPHYHAIIFGTHFPDRYHWTTRNNNPSYRSDTLEALWPLGNSEISDVTFESAAYVARYIMKKVTGAQAGQHYQILDPSTGELISRQPEYATMSRRPGIGTNWLSRFGSDTYLRDRIYMRGQYMKPPRAYDRLWEILNPKEMETIKHERLANRNRARETVRHLEASEATANARLNLYKRDLQ